MRLSDNAIILAVNKKSGKSAIISTFTENHGLYSGYVSISKKHFCALQIGNILQIDWSARLSTHLGRLYFELLEAIPAFFLHHYNKMLALSAIAKTLAKILPEREPKLEIYHAFYNLLCALKQSEQWIIHYIKLELVTLKQLGFGLDLQACPVNNSSHDLTFISPKTGRAISHSAGIPYKDKLLHLPSTLYSIYHDKQNVGNVEKEFAECLKVTNYFLHKHCFHACNIPIPIERELLYRAFVEK